MIANSTSRFSNRVEDYVKYRPGYPAEIVTWLQENYNLLPGHLIADIGSGTGISSMLFLKAGYNVLGIEPNKEMREMSVKLLAQYPHFLAIDGTAEATSLRDKSIDAIICGQAFHWFNTQKTKPEFTRVLKKNVILVLIWTERLTDTAFEKEYDQLIIKHGNDYLKVDHRNINTDQIASFFEPQVCELKIFANEQVFDFDGLKGRLLSSSYMPALNEPGYDNMIIDLCNLFEKYQENDTIKITYDTKVYAGVFNV
ncbi:MAG: class I SAM-dependent methyltransferase [Bacteroidota bacterium]